MVRRILFLGVLVAFVFSFSGCATRNSELLNQGLKNKVLALEESNRQKDDEINVLREELARGSQEQAGTAKKVGEVKERPTPKQIQVALKNAGYYQGVIDGKLGRNSRQAIKDFQKANNLTADGKVGKKTWEALKEYLEKKVK